MCDPVSAMIGLTLAGTAVSAAGSIAQGNSAKELAGFQAAAYEQQARAQQNTSAFEQLQARRKQDLAASQGRADVGASGLAITGSPTEVLVENAGQGELDIAAIQYGSTLKQNQLRTQGKISIFSGEQAQKAGYIAGVSTLLTGAGKAIQMGVSPFSAPGRGATA